MVSNTKHPLIGGHFTDKEDRAVGTQPSIKLEACHRRLLAGDIEDGQQLGEIGRLGARLVLQRGVEEEVAIFVAGTGHARTPDARGSRNGVRMIIIDTRSVRAKSLTELEVQVLFLDAIYLPTRPSGAKEGVLVVWGYTVDRIPTQPLSQGLWRHPQLARY